MMTVFNFAYRVFLRNTTHNIWKNQQSFPFYLQYFSMFLQKKRGMNHLVFKLLLMCVSNGYKRWDVWSGMHNNYTLFSSQICMFRKDTWLKCPSTINTDFWFSIFTRCFWKCLRKSIKSCKCRTDNQFVFEDILFLNCMRINTLLT